MKEKPTTEEAPAYEALDRLLFYEWDPIGVSSNRLLADEYRDFLPEFWALVKGGAPEEEIAEYLGRIEAEQIEVETSLQHRLEVARKAVALVAAWSMPVRH